MSRDAPWGPPWKIMTPEEYRRLVLKGHHVVERDHEGSGLVAVWLTPQTPADRWGEEEGWRPIESAPDDHRLLFWWPTIPDPENSGALMHRPMMVGCLNALRRRKPTHWRPLPTPPCSAKLTLGESSRDAIDPVSPPPAGTGE